MSDAKTSARDKILKNILGTIASGTNSEDSNGTRDLVFSFLSKAGKGKDEVIQILGREIGLALAAVLAKPLEQMTENKRVRITVELVPKAKRPRKSKK